MKRVYESPVMMLEWFEASEYVAACWDVICKGTDGIDINPNHHPEDIHGSDGNLGFLIKTEGDSEPVPGNKGQDALYIDVVHINGNSGTPFDVNVYNNNGVLHWNVTWDLNERPNAS